MTDTYLAALNQFPGTSRVLTNFMHLDLPIPLELEEAIETFGISSTRVRELTQHMQPTPFTHEDLGKPDWTKRLERAAMSRTSSEYHHSLARKALEKHKVLAEGVFKKSKAELFQTLQQWYEENYADLEAEGDLSRHPAEAKALTEKRTWFEQAHFWLAPDLGSLSGSAQWFIKFEWTPQTYQQLVDNTGPDCDPRGANTYALARRSGGTPRIIRDKKQLLTEHQYNGPGSDRYGAQPLSQQEGQALARSHKLWGTPDTTIELDDTGVNVY